MKTMIRNWNIFRFIRLALGIVVIIQGFSNHEILFGIAGVFLSLTALANVGCCGSNGCAVNTKQLPSKTGNEIIYEEVDGVK